MLLSSYLGCPLHNYHIVMQNENKYWQKIPHFATVEIAMNCKLQNKDNIDNKRYRFIISIHRIHSSEYYLVMPLEDGLAHLEFGSSVNPIKTRGVDYAHHITASPPGFESPAASLLRAIFNI